MNPPLNVLDYIPLPACGARFKVQQIAAVLPNTNKLSIEKLSILAYQYAECGRVTDLQTGLASIRTGCDYARQTH